ncbi:MAG: PAS domain S-box protein, partial [Mariniphaga sp.]
MTKKLRRFILLFAGLLFLCTTTFAQTDSLITVGIYQNPPKVYFDENRKPAGIFVELLEEIARLENWQVNYVPCSWNDCLQALESGEIDLMPDVAFNLERMQRYAFNTVSVISSWSQVYARPGVNINKLSDLEGKNVALVEGSVQQPFFRQMMNGFGYQYRQVHAASFSDAFSEVKIGIADAAVVNNFFGDAQYKKYDLVRTPVIFSPASLHFAVKKSKNTWIIETIDKYLTDWKQTPESFYYKTVKNHIPQPEFSEESHSHLPFYLLIGGFLVAAILLFFFLYKQLKKQTKKLIKTNKKLSYEEQKFKSYIEHAPYGIFVTNEKGEYVDVNETACKLTGYSRKEIIGKMISDIITDEGKNRAINHFNTVVKEGKASAIIPFINKNGEKFLSNVTAARVSPRRFIGFVEDATEEHKLRNRLQIMQMVFDQSVNEIYLFDISDFKFRYVNEAAIDNTGYTAQELEKMTPLDLKQNILPPQFDSLIQPLVRKEKKMVKFEAQHFRKDGTCYDAEIYLQLLENENEKLFSAVVLDITDRKNKEKELQRIKEELEKEVTEKTRELNNRITELENFREATI